MGRVTIAVIQFGGSNCDRDAVQALESLGFDAELVWHEDGLPEDVEGVVLPGGFSYGDYLRAGAMAARSPIMADVREVASEGTPVLGICNGAQSAASHPSPKARSQRTRAPASSVNTSTPRRERRHAMDQPYEDGEVVELPIAHGEGRYEITDERLDELEAEDRFCQIR